MRQAIEEGFILDVLKNYTTYTTYYRLVKAVEDDPNLPKKKGARALAKFMSLHPHNIEQKTEVMVEHFRQQRETAISVDGPRRWSLPPRDCTRCATCRPSSVHRGRHGYTDVRPLVAFSGTVRDPEYRDSNTPSRA